MPLVQKLNSQHNMQTPDLNFSGKLFFGGGGTPNRAVQEWPMLHHLGTEPSTLWCSVPIVGCQRVNLLMSCVKDYMWPVMICCDWRITFFCITWILAGLGNTEQAMSKLQPSRLHDSKLSWMNHSYMNSV
jgi:hypothetical protein